MTTAAHGASGGTTAATSSQASNVVNIRGQGTPGEEKSRGEYAVQGSPGWTYTPGVGLWREAKRMLSWCPTVVRQAMRVDDSAGTDSIKISSRTLVVRIGDEVTTLTDAELADGKAWSKFSTAPGVGDRNVREVLRNVVAAQASGLPRESIVARWHKGRLHLPPPDLLPAGYGVAAGTAEEYAAVLREIIDSPRIVLALGLAVAGLYVLPLGRQSYVVHMVGNSSQGKTTAQRVVAGFFGKPDPKGIILSWAVTGKGPGAWLRSLELLPGFRNDIGAAKMRAGEWETAILAWCEGAGRDQSSREGDHMTSPGSWYGALCSTGNDGLIDMVSNQAIAARVVEITPPLTTTEQQAKWIGAAMRKTYGHGLAALVERGPSPEEFEAMIGKAEAALGMPGGDVSQRVAEHIAGGIAGAALVADLFGVPELIDAATLAGREVFTELSEGLHERGAHPGDKLLIEVADYVAQYPALFPTRAEAEKSSTFPVREVAGWDISGEDGPGELAVLMAPMKTIAEQAEITDRMVALKDLRKRGMLIPSSDGKNLARLLKVAGKPKRVYVLRGVTPDQEDSVTTSSEPPDAPVTTSVTTLVTTSDQGSNDGNDFSASEAYRESRAEGATVSQGEIIYAESPDPVAAAGDPCRVCPGPGKWCGRGGVAAEPVPCVCCGEPTKIRSACGAARNAVCRGEPIEAPRPRPGETPRPSELGQWAVSEAFPDATREELTESERLWHEHMRGVRFSIPINTAARILSGALKHQSIPELQPLDLGTLTPLQDGRKWSSRTWAVPGETLPAEKWIGAYDINGMWPSAGSVNLGSGNPELTDDGLPNGWTKRPGWGRLAADIEGAPYGLNGRMVRDMWIPIPLLAYLAERGVPFTVGAALTWPQSRRWLAPHVKMYREARYGLAQIEGRPARITGKAVKDTFNRMFGAAMHSAKYNKHPRPDWYAEVTSTAQARLFRNLDKIGAQVVGIKADCAWLVIDGPDSDPDKLDPNTGQLGKFKRENRCPITPDVIKAHEMGLWLPISKALKGE